MASPTFEVKNPILFLSTAVYKYFAHQFQMEKYSKHLEAVVAERTQDLLQEKQKTDRLLYSKILIYHWLYFYCSLVSY